MLDQRQRRWTDVVQMLYKCFVFTGMGYKRRWTDVVQMLYKYFVFTGISLYNARLQIMYLILLREWYLLAFPVENMWIGYNGIIE